jgi:hypothetical protein
MRSALPVTFSCICLALLPGCGAPAPSSVTGNVSYLGATVENGSLRFYPTTKESGRGATALIKEGKFEIPLDKGLLPGPYVVSVNAQKLSGPKAAGIPKLSGPGTDNPLDQTEYIPLEYNVGTKFEVVIEPGVNEKDITLPVKE